MTDAGMFLAINLVWSAVLIVVCGRLLVVAKQQERDRLRRRKFLKWNEEQERKRRQL